MTSDARQAAQEMEAEWMKRPTVAGPVLFLMSAQLYEGCTFMMQVDKSEFLVGLFPPKASPGDICHGRDADIVVAILDAIQQWHKALESERE
jgi:hypothetical protein